MTFVPRDISAVLDPALEQRPDTVAVEGRSGRLTYRQLDEAASHAAGGLWERGVRPGDRLAACLPNDVAVVVAFHAAMRIGAVWVGIGSALALPEKLRLLRHSSPRLLLVPPDLASQLRSDPAAGTDSPRIVTVGPVDDAVDDEDEWQSLLAAELGQPRVDIDPHGPAGIAYTSGTTGSPKGIVHSQHNLLMPGAVVVGQRGYGPELRKGDCLPLTILNLMALTTLLTSQAGGCCVVMDRRDARGVAEWIRDARINVWNGVPTQLWDLITDPDICPADLATLRDVWSGGADCPDELRENFAAKFGHALRATYGLTEVPTIVAMDPPGDEWSTRASGQVLGHLSVTVLDDEGNPLPAGRIGELCVSPTTSGPWANQWTPMLGEWRGDGVAKSQPGSLRTGDLGFLDDQGWLHVVDRAKLLIVRGGANVYPTEVERVLLRAPGVRGAAVFGVPDDRLGQRVAALVEPDDNAARPAVSDLTDHCAAQLARYKVPEVWGFVDALPRNAMGKIVRPELAGLLESGARV
jgi:long-chain acyl-CoA synthetase